jgi:ATP-binding cassette subfamily B protein
MKIKELDIGTIEQPEFRNIYDRSGNVGLNAIFNLVNSFTNFIQSSTRIIVAAISLFVISPLVFVIILLGALPTYFFEKKNAIASALIQKTYAEENRMWRAKTQVIYEKDTVIELKNYSLIKVFHRKFLEIIGRIHDKQAKNYQNMFLNNVISDVILVISYIIAFVLLIKYVIVGKIAVGSLVFAFGVVTQFQSALNTLLSTFGRMAEYKKNVDSVLDLIEMQPMIVSGARKINRDDFKTLEIVNVSFHYPGSEKIILRHINLTITKNINIAIIGLNGAGKSTLLKLIARVYDPTHGNILLNGIDLKEYDLESWRSCLGILLQEYGLYSEESVAENIMLGDVSKHKQELVEKSAKESTAHEFIKELPETYQQKVGTEFHGGIELSKGQKQKVALARVLYRDAPIMILDEPTASVDALSEDAIFKSLREHHKHQTRVIISHKFSNVRDADKIILIEHGTIIEQGSHTELMEINNGRYKELFELQAEGYK